MTTHSDSNRFLNFRPDIDGLRAIAVMLVIASHCGFAGAAGGFVGVDVFFVLSGYLITGILVNEVRATGRIDLSGFYARRIRRLLPASALMLLVTLGLGLLLMAPLELQSAGRAARATALYLSNVFFALNGGDYFGHAVRGNPLLHTWSLAVEEQFYVFWPLTILLAHRFGTQRALPWILGLILAVSLAASLLLSTPSPVYSYYGLHTRAWEFAVGGLAGILPAGALRLKSSAAQVVSWAGFIAILCCALLVGSEAGYPGYQALLPVLATTAVLVAAKEMPAAGAAPLLSTAPMQLIGAVSYSWYLWHWPFIVFAGLLFVDIAPLGNLAAALLSFVVAYASYRFVENPIRHSRALTSSRGRTFALGALLTLSCATIAMLVTRHATQEANGARVAPFMHASEDIASMDRNACVNLRGNAAPLRCSYGDTASATTVVLFGDSHAVQWFDGFLAAAKARQWHLVTFLKSGCPAADISPANLWSADRDECGRWRRQVFAELGTLRPTLVAMASYTGQVSAAPGAQLISEADWQAATRRTLDALAPATGRRLLILDTPRPGFDAPSCLARLALHPAFMRNDCSLPQQRSTNPAARRAEQSAAAASSAGIFDPVALLCGDGRCPAVHDGIVVYRDDNHLTASFARSQASAIQTAVERELSPTLR